MIGKGSRYPVAEVQVKSSERLHIGYGEQCGT